VDRVAHGMAEVERAECAAREELEEAAAGREKGLAIVVARVHQVAKEEETDAFSAPRRERAGAVATACVCCHVLRRARSAMRHSTRAARQAAQSVQPLHEERICAAA